MPLRLLNTTAATMISAATTAIATRSAVFALVADAPGHHGRRDQQRDQVHHLDQRVDRRTGGVLERVADGVADDRGGVRLASPCRRTRRPRPSSWRCPRRHRSWPGRPPSGCRRRSHRPGTPPARPAPRPKPTAIGARMASRPGVISSRCASRVQMSTTLPYSGRWRAVHDARAARGTAGGPPSPPHRPSGTPR